MPYACPRCERLVPDDHADEAARWLLCESCGERFEGLDVAGQKRWAPPPPPPPVELFGVPVAVDVYQPGDGTIEFRIAHFQRRRHGPELAVWFLWLVAFGVGTVLAARSGGWGLASAGALFAYLGVRNIQRVGALASTFTHVRWDRVSGAMSVWSTGGEPVRIAYGPQVVLALRPGANGLDLVALPSRPLAADVPARATEWVITALRALAVGPERA